MNSITVKYMARKKEVTVSVRMDPELREQIDRRATNYNTSRAAVLRQLIEEGMKAHIKLLPSASALEKEITSLNQKLDKIAETLHTYSGQPPKPVRKTTTAD